LANSGKILVSAAMLAIFAGMVAMAFGYPPDGRFLPFVIGIPGTVLCVIQLALDIAESRRESGRRLTAEERRNLRVAGALFVWLVGFMAAILLLGFLVAMPLVLFAFLRLQQREPLPLSLALSAGGLAGMWLVFDVMLRLPLHEGFLIEWLAG
jgi:hypothetical protein